MNRDSDETYDREITLLTLCDIEEAFMEIILNIFGCIGIRRVVRRGLTGQIDDHINHRRELKARPELEDLGVLNLSACESRQTTRHSIPQHGHWRSKAVWHAYKRLKTGYNHFTSTTNYK